MLYLTTLSVGAYAQDTLITNLPKQWSLEYCLSYAEKNNVSLAILKLTTRLSEEDLLQAKAAVLPNLNGTVSQSLVNGKNVNNVTGNYQDRVNLSSSYGLNSSMILYNGGYLRNDIRAKKLSVQSANLSVKEAANNLALSITQAYFNILLAHEIMISFESVLQTSQGQLIQGQQKYDAGAIARKELLQFQSQVASDQYNLINATNNFRLNTVDLKQLLLLPTSFNFQAKVPDSIPLPLVPVSLYEAQGEAQRERPEIQNGEVQIQLARVELEKIHASTKPTISLGGGLATGYSNNQTAKYVPQLNNNFYQSLAVTMGIPIYSRRVNKTNINKTEILLRQSELALLDTKIILNQLVERTYINLLNAQAQYRAADIQLQTSEQIYFITNEQLKLGAVNTVELLQQKNAYIQALQSFIQAKYTMALYNKIYEFYRGIPVRF